MGINALAANQWLEEPVRWRPFHNSGSGGGIVLALSYGHKVSRRSPIVSDDYNEAFSVYTLTVSWWSLATHTQRLKSLGCAQLPQTRREVRTRRAGSLLVPSFGHLPRCPVKGSP